MGDVATLDVDYELAGRDDGAIRARNACVMSAHGEYKYEVDYWSGRNIDSKLNKFV
jgi:hypothetical protein